MKRCNCQHAGHCLLSPPPDGDPTLLTFLDGSPVFRKLTSEETGAKILPGDFVATRRLGDVTVIGRAVDPDRILAAVQRLKGRNCVWTPEWAKKNPIPPEN